jgi:hypothetical protein
VISELAEAYLYASDNPRDRDLIEAVTGHIMLWTEAAEEILRRNRVSGESRAERHGYVPEWAEPLAAHMPPSPPRAAEPAGEDEVPSAPPTRHLSAAPRHSIGMENLWNDQHTGSVRRQPMGLAELLADRLDLDAETRLTFLAICNGTLAELRSELDGTSALQLQDVAGQYNAEMFVLDIWAQARKHPPSQGALVTWSGENGDEIESSWFHCTPGDLLVASEALRNSAENRLMRETP